MHESFFIRCTWFI